MPAESARRFRPINAAVPAKLPDAWGPSSLGHFPPIAFAAGIGLLVCSVANALSRATLAPSPLIYWAGILVIAVPIFYRLTSREASAAERLGLVCLLGLSLYAVKVVRDAPIYTFSDELVHSYNANQIVAGNHLFHANSIIPVTPYYPGLEGATSALMNLTGMSSFGAGIVLVGAARLSMVAAMFLLFARLSGSARTAGLGVAIYTGNFNFLFWGAQFSYESLALPLLVVILMAVAERESGPGDRIRAWALPIVLGTAAVVVTHHLTSYALMAVLAALALTYWLVRRSWRERNPWPFAIVAAALATVWLVVVASSTVGYLFPVLTTAIKATFHTAAGEAPPRAPFQDKASGIEATPLAARGIALLAIAILAAGLPFGLLRVWRRYRRQPFVLIFSVAAIGFFGTLALRLAPAAWETGNRASEFLFIGLAFVLAGVGLERWRPRVMPGLGRVALTGAIAVVLVGGAISGWPWDAQLASPVRVEADGATIVSPPLGMAEWAAENVPDQRFAAAIADSRLLLDPGGEAAIAGESPDVKDIINEPSLEDWELPLLRENDLRYVAADRREIAGDGTRGYFFTERGTAAAEELLPLSSVTKFEKIPGAAPVYDNGDIIVYDLEGRK